MIKTPPKLKLTYCYTNNKLQNSWIMKKYCDELKCVVDFIWEKNKWINRDLEHQRQIEKIMENFSKALKTQETARQEKKLYDKKVHEFMKNFKENLQKEKSKWMKKQNPLKKR